MILYKTPVSPLLTQWRCYSLALSHRSYLNHVDKGNYCGIHRETQSSHLSQERIALDTAHKRAKMHTTGQKHTTGRRSQKRAYANKRYLHKPNNPFCSYSWLIRSYVKHYGDSRTQQTVLLSQIWAVVQIVAFKTTACTSARGGHVP